VPDEPRTILLCYDGSPQADHAVEAAARLFPGAHTRVLYIWEPVERIIARYAVLAPLMGEEVERVDDDLESEADKLLAHGVELAANGGLDAAPHRRRLGNTVWETVLAAADELGADVIVTGTRSLHGLREVIANTLSHHLIQHSPVPVLAIPTPVREDAR
jgi:nucleotide-binding universal stress UspA family protein